MQPKLHRQHGQAEHHPRPGRAKNREVTLEVTPLFLVYLSTFYLGATLPFQSHTHFLHWPTKYKLQNSNINFFRSSYLYFHHFGHFSVIWFSIYSVFWIWSYVPARELHSHHTVLPISVTFYYYLLTVPLQVQTVTIDFKPFQTGSVFTSALCSWAQIILQAI